MKLRRVLTILLILVPMLSASAQGQSLIDRFYAGTADSCLDISYSYSTRISGILNNGQGHLSAQGLMWRVKGNGVEMFCDARSLWIIDKEMKEVVIEPAVAEGSSEFMDNPALMLSRLGDDFSVAVSRTIDDGKAVHYTLHPKVDIGIDYFNVELKTSDASVRRASFAMGDGTMVKIEVGSMKLTPKVPAETFRPKIVFSSEWIVNDLR